MLWIDTHHARTGMISADWLSAAQQQPDRLNLGVAAAIISAIPVLLLLIFFQKQIIRGLTAGAVKG